MKLERSDFTKKKNGPGGRIAYLDLLRVSSILAVMVMHISGQNWGSVGVEGAVWHTLNAFNSLSRWGAPVFVMISGALTLDRDYSPRDWRRKLGRLGVAFLFWSTAYALVECLTRDLTVKDVLLQIVAGHYHMWFLFMIAGLYLIAPLLRKITESKKLTEYFLLLALVFNFAVPQLVTLLSLANPSLADAANVLLDKICFRFALGYSGFFVLGHYLHKTELSRKARRAIYALSVCGFIATAAGTAALSSWQGTPDDALHTYFSLNVLAESVGVFVFFQYHTGGGEPRAAVAALSDATFGVYLVHPMVQEFLKSVLRLDALTFAPVLSVPLVALILAVVSYALSLAIGKIPKVGKIIV